VKLEVTDTFFAAQKHSVRKGISVQNIQSVRVVLFALLVLFWHRDPSSKSVILKNSLLLVFKKAVLFWIQKASVNMTARFSVKNSHIEYILILVLQKKKPTVKVITVRLVLLTDHVLFVLLLIFTELKDIRTGSSLVDM
jgi:hypothetical protein